MIRRRFLLTVISQLLILTLLGASSALGNGNKQPPLNRTGAPSQSQSCAQCHTSNGSGGVSLNFSGGAEYQPGGDYSMAVTVTDPGQLRFGFSMVARDASNNTADVGTWSVGSADTRPHGPGNSHISHVTAPNAGGSHTFTVNWKAPAAGVGNITFYLAGVAANGNGGSGPGDNTYVTQVTISEPAPPNQAPVITVPQDLIQVAPAASIAITGISVSDPDAGGASIFAQLTAGNGQITIADSVPGGVEADDIISGNGTSQVTFRGTLAQLNATFADPGGVIYQSSPGFVGAETVVVKADDIGHSGSGGAMKGEASFEILVSQPVTISNPTHLGAGGFEFTVNGVPGQAVVVEFSEDLKSWKLLEERTLAVEMEKVTDTGAANSPRRFYRVR